MKNIDYIYIYIYIYIMLLPASLNLAEPRYVVVILKLN